MSNEDDMAKECNKARIDEVNRYDTDEDMYKELRLAELSNKENK